MSSRRGTHDSEHSFDVKKRTNGGNYYKHSSAVNLLRTSGKGSRTMVLSKGYLKAATDTTLNQCDHELEEENMKPRFMVTNNAVS